MKDEGQRQKNEQKSKLKCNVTILVKIFESIPCGATEGLSIKQNDEE
jgi:hypothetical protein